MAVAPAVVRGPDIIIRTAPPLSATSDAPLADVPRPPVSASNNGADQARGVSREMTMQEKAAAEAARSAAAGAEALAPADTTTETTEATEAEGQAEGGDDAAAIAARKAADQDAVPDELEIDGKKVPTPPYMKREITKERNRRRDAEAARVTAEKAAQVATEAAAAAQRELAELKAKAETPKPAEPVVEAAPDPKPTRDAFEDPDAYDNALTEWGVREGERKAATKIATDKAAAEAVERTKTEEAARTAQEAQQAQLNADWTARRTAAAEKYADYAEVAEADPASGGPVITDAMASAIVLSENGTDIAYHLGQNTDVAERIAKIQNPFLQFLEIGKLAATLATPPQRRAPRNRPIEPIDTSTAPADTSEAEPDMETYAKQRMAALRQQRAPFFPAGQMH